MLSFNWILVILIGLLVLVLAGYLLYQYGFNTISQYVKSLLGVSYSQVYNLYGYEYVPGVRSNGPVLKMYDNVKSDLICANYAAATEGCVGANYMASTFTCELVSDLLPLMHNDLYETIVMSATNMRNRVSAFTSAPSVTQSGIMFCDTSLAYIPYAAALCASIPSCSGYITTFASDTNAPMGCLCMTGENGTLLTDTKATLYTGTRTDGVVYNTSTNESGPYFRWRTDVSDNASDVLSNAFVKTLDECGESAQATIGAIAATWDPNTGGTCTIYSALHPIASDANKTYITWKANQSYLKYSNTYNKLLNTDYPSAAKVTTGLENSIAYSLSDAIRACVNTDGCNCITQDTTNTFTFLNVKSSDAVSNSSSKTAYVVPSQFN